MSKQFPSVFEPLEIRGKPFKNRFFMAAHGTGYAEEGGVGPAQLAYFEERLKNDIALLISEASPVTPLPGMKYRLLNASSDDCIPGYEKVAEMCHRYGARYFVQLFEYGRAMGHSLDGSKQIVLGPSAEPDERYHTTPRMLSITEIETLVTRFGEAASRAYRAGADGVEILVGMGYLHSQFLSPRVNTRTDRYGGSPEARVRFLDETLQSMRASTDDDFIIGIRIAGEEGDPDGLRIGDTLEACKALDRDGRVDFVNICVGGTHTLTGTAMIVPPMFEQTALSLPHASMVREAVSVPVLTAGRINQPQDAERAVRDGSADMIGLVRALIADPKFVSKAAADEPDEIRACIACNQACIGHRPAGFGVSCIQYPETGREAQYAQKKTVETPRKIMVVGGGPGGMKAAVVAAERGHDVTLFEKSTKLGGQALLAQALPGRAEFGGLVTNLMTEIRRFGVSVKLNTEVLREFIEQQSPDAVIVATGSRPRIPVGEFEGAHMVTSQDVIEGRVNVGKSVVIADWACDWAGLGLAEMLASDGCSVKLCVNGEMAGQSIQSYVRTIWAGRLHRLGVQILPLVRLFGADADTVYFQHVMSGEPVICESVDTLVLSYGNVSENKLYDELVGGPIDVHGIGDCMSPRTAEEAVLEGLKAGASV